MSYANQLRQKLQFLSNISFPVHPKNPGNFKLIEKIDRLFDVYYSAEMIFLQDQDLYSESDEFLKRFYELRQFSTKIELLSEYYRFHQQFPRIFIEGVSKIMSASIEDKRALQYEHVKKKMKEGQCIQPLTSRRTVQFKERLLADIEVSYEDFQKKQMTKKQNKQKQLKRVISVHCKEGSGFRKQCKQGIFLNHRAPVIQNKGVSKQKAGKQRDGSRKISVDVKANQACLKKQKTYYKQSMKTRKESAINTRNPSNKIHRTTGSSQASQKNRIIKSTNISSASSLSRSKSKNNLLCLQQNKNCNHFYKNDIKQDLKNQDYKKKENRENNPVIAQSKSSKIIKVSQNVSIKSTILTNKQKGIKSQSCKFLRGKQLIGVNNNKLEEEKIKKPSTCVQNTQSLMKALQKPINNMFNKVIQARKR